MQTALVTGASRGIGFEVARQLARKGYRVLAGTRSGRGVPEATEPFQLDVASPKSIDAAAERIEALHLLVNNAAINEGAARQIWETNVRGPLLLTGALAPKMPAGGRVVMVSSGMGALASQSPALQRRLPAATFADIEALIERAEGRYGATKATLNALTRLFAAEYPRLRINAVSPGWVRTEMGGAGAPRSIEQGAASILQACEIPADGPTGRLFYDGEEVAF